jgi:RIO kinase 1
MRKEREQRAVAKRSKVGLEILHSSWLTNELNMLRTLHAAGVIVPKPLGSNDNAIVMEFLGDEVYAAPPLESVTLQKREAQRLFKLLVDNVLLMLKLGVVHGDLSAFNVLYWQGEVRIIDFPQALNVEKNPHAYKVFVRDVTRVCDYFARYDIRTYAAGLAKDLWSDALRISESELHEVQHARIEKAQWYAAQ